MCAMEHQRASPSVTVGRDSTGVVTFDEPTPQTWHTRMRRRPGGGSSRNFVNAIFCLKGRIGALCAVTSRAHCAPVLTPFWNDIVLSCC